ncbi:MAG: hypothetical protein GX591_11115 [Planctomycetes bacterium]|mgnify:CR=1 FL=1|nr:hypothetical protein [Planctomycetota bacterium]
MNEPAEPHIDEPQTPPDARAGRRRKAWVFAMAGCAAALVANFVAPLWLNAAILVVLVNAVLVVWARGHRVRPLAVVACLWAVPVLIGLVTTAKPRLPRATPRSVLCMTRLKGIGNGIALYAMQYADAWPPDLHALVVDNVVELRQLECPVEATAGGLDFFYTPPAWAGDPSPPPEDTTIIACDLRRNHSDRTRNVLLCGSRVDRLGEDDFQALLTRPENAAFAAALRAAEGP